MQNEEQTLEVGQQEDSTSDETSQVEKNQDDTPSGQSVPLPKCSTSKPKPSKQPKSKLPALPRELRRKLKAQITNFLDHATTEELILSGLPNDQRRFLHGYAHSLGLESKSYGSKDDRVLHIRLRRKYGSLNDTRFLTLSEESKTYFTPLLVNEMKQQTLPLRSMQNGIPQRKHIRSYHECFTLGLGQRMVPPRQTRFNQIIQNTRQELPIFQYQGAILDALRNHPVIIINGQTGSGKTTQVPQYILEECCRLKTPCRIICTQPRRIATLTVSSRVAEERCEQLGETVGYQMRLENRLRKTTNLIYMTSGCVLRSVMSSSRDFFQKITHLIIDEIHERDKDTDFILIAVKEQLQFNKNLRVILMSATMDIALLSNYFNGCPIIDVPGQGYKVKVYFLEDILYHTGYRTSLMKKYLRVGDLNLNGTNDIEPCEFVLQQYHATLDSLQNSTLKSDHQTDLFDQLLFCVEHGSIPIDTCHIKTGKTPLIMAAEYNSDEYIAKFLELNANRNLCDFSGNTALDYAALFEDGICFELLTNAQVSNDVLIEKRNLLTAYNRQLTDDNEVDHYLILSLIEGLYRSSHPGAILVFLPGYNDIVACRELITSTLPLGTYKMFVLHGQMESSDQKLAMQPQRNRKIVLSTNIGQTSITIPDLAFIIDSGRVKMKTHDVITGSSELRSVWISQADSNQRCGRAGRTQNGVCYRLYSRHQFLGMSKHSIPELMRIPLTEICLYAKSFDPQTDVSEFLSRSLNPPSSITVEKSIRLLKTIGVFTENEQITELGKHLVEIPVDVQLGKALMYSIFYKCVAPVVTIVAFHSVKDPFVLPSDRSLQGQASYQRKTLAGNHFSDHMGIPALYDSYMALRSRKKKIEFCNKFFLSIPSMEIFVATRRQIYDVLCSRYMLTSNCSSNATNWNVVRLCLVAGLHPNIALIDRLQMNIKSDIHKQLILQRSSSLNPPGKKNLKEFVAELPYDWIVFYEKTKLFGRYHINMNTLVAPVLVALHSGQEYKVDKGDYDEEPSDECHRNLLTIGSWINFDVSAEDAEILTTLRDYVQSEFYKFLTHGHSESSYKAVNHVQYLLEAEIDYDINKS